MAESDEQAALAGYLDARGIPFYHVPNEGKRSPRGGAALKRAGLKPGVPDVCVPVARGGYHSLYIEMKSGRGRVAPAQERWIRLLREQGMCAYACYGAEDAITLVERYMSL